MRKRYLKRENLYFIWVLKTTLLKGDCLHYSYYSVQEHINQTKKFSPIAADMLHSQGKKATFIKRFISPLVKFTRDYFFKLGFLSRRSINRAINGNHW